MVCLPLSSTIGHSEAVFIDVPPIVRIEDEAEEDHVDTTGDDTPRNRRLSGASEATVTLHHTHGSDSGSDLQTVVASGHESKCATYIFQWFYSFL